MIVSTALRLESMLFLFLSPSISTTKFRTSREETSMNISPFPASPTPSTPAVHLTPALCGDRIAILRADLEFLREGAQPWRSESSCLLTPNAKGLSLKSTVSFPLTSSWFFLRQSSSSLRDSTWASRSALHRVSSSRILRRLFMSDSTSCRKERSVSYLHTQTRAGE